VKETLEQQIAQRFRRDTAGHELTVLHDDGLYRHLRLRAPRTSEYWFDLITIPGALIFRGDGKSFTFARLEDMFEFFRGRPGRINAHYWAEKLTSGRDGLVRFDVDKLTSWVREYTAEAIREGWAPRGTGKAVTGLLEEIALLGDTDERGARDLLEQFGYGSAWTASCSHCWKSGLFDGDEEYRASQWATTHEQLGAEHRTRVAKQDAFTFGEDLWEISFAEYDWWFLWALHGIVWGIAQYDRERLRQQQRVSRRRIRDARRLALGAAL
jgi:hypothetical protein